jgi:DNA-binding LytR/AlgR family response regulator
LRYTENHGGGKVKIKLIVSDEKYTQIATELIKNGHEIDDDADFILSERNVHLKYLIGKSGDEIFRLDVTKISHIESFSHDVIAHCDGGEYKISERLRRLEETLDPKEFLRISNSVIVSVSHIKSIKPALSQKFVLTMTDGSKVDVTRSYYYIFKDFIGI